MASENKKKPSDVSGSAAASEAKGTEWELDRDAAERLCHEWSAAPKEKRQALLETKIPIVYGNETNYLVPEEFKRFKADLAKYGFYQEWTCAGYTCWATRDARFGFWCGYVTLPTEHKLYGADLEEDTSIDVHQGVTCASMAKDFHKDVQALWSDSCRSMGGWVVGFDTNHDVDWNPVGNPCKRETSSNPVYRDFPFIQSELEKLIKQLDTIEPRAATEDAENEDEWSDG